jgi:hypothetical protein
LGDFLNNSSGHPGQKQMFGGCQCLLSFFAHLLWKSDQNCMLKMSMNTCDKCPGGAAQWHQEQKIVGLNPSKVSNGKHGDDVV